MNETLTTVRGTIVSDPRTRHAGEDAVVSLRIACNNRYQNRESGEWRTSSTLYLTVNCWGRLAGAVGGRLVIGDGIIVQGRLSSNEFTKDDVKRNDLEMRAVAIGADMARAEVVIKRRARVKGDGSTESEPSDQGAEGAGRAPKEWDVDSHDESDGAPGGDTVSESTEGLVGAGASERPPF